MGELAAAVRGGDVSAVSWSRSRWRRSSAGTRAERVRDVVRGARTGRGGRGPGGDARPLAGSGSRSRTRALTEGVRTRWHAAMERVDAGRRQRPGAAVARGRAIVSARPTLPRWASSGHRAAALRPRAQPLGHSRTPGGSSGGSAAAVASACAGRHANAAGLDPHPGVVLRPGRPEAEPRAGLAGAGVHRVRRRGRDRRMREPQRRRPALILDDLRLRARRPLLGTRSLCTVRRSGRAQPAGCASPTPPRPRTACRCTTTARRPWSRPPSCCSRSDTRSRSAAVRGRAVRGELHQDLDRRSRGRGAHTTAGSAAARSTSTCSSR